MPQMEIDISCPGCNAIFSVPVELCGEMAECTECSAVFEIPGIVEVPPTLNTDTDAIKGIPAPAPAPGESSPSAATNTVKLSRASIGMIPGLKESFTLGQNALGEPDSASPSATPWPKPSTPAKKPVITQSPVFQTQTQPKLSFVQPPPPPPPPPAKPMAPAAPAPAHTTASQQSAQQKTSSTQTSISGQQIAQAVMLPAWTKIQLKPEEELQACREINKKPALAAVLASLPVLLTVVAVFFAKTQFVLAFVLVIVLWIITFGIAFLMTKDNSKRAIVITSQRTICIIGKDRIELKK